MNTLQVCSLAFALLVAFPAHASDCYRISNPDDRNACLAHTK